MHTEAHLFSLPNDCLWYDKLWGPSQRVVTLLLNYVSKTTQGMSMFDDSRDDFDIGLYSVDKL